MRTSRRGRSLARARFEEGEGGGARLLLALGRNRILEVEDHGVGAARHRLVELGAAVGGDEEKGAHLEA